MIIYATIILMSIAITSLVNTYNYPKAEKEIEELIICEIKNEDTNVCQTQFSIKLISYVILSMCYCLFGTVTSIILGSQLIYIKHLKRIGKLISERNWKQLVSMSINSLQRK
eukprot:TRINITY_DN969_c0_g1_i2.p2 TRINITY_DN969_c0_g1~~TRINITY_DN969_c0_g1_i2.p2  ORF type:complete len:112 (-),score=27.77 TRINITY_DN969_c0_g1_i2:41-376(-)